MTDGGAAISAGVGECAAVSLAAVHVTGVIG
jgi:hypothetical protein